MVKNVLLTSILFQMIMSPQFPSNYSPNINCHWVVSAPRREHVHLKFLDFNLESSAQCTKDSLSIKDLSSRDSVRNHPNASMIVSSDRVSSSRFHSVTFFVVIFLFIFFILSIQSSMRQNVKYCGQELPHRFDSQRNTLEIRFKSDGENGRRGFKLQYSLQSKTLIISLGYD